MNNAAVAAPAHREAHLRANLEGSLAVVTGAAHGIGRACAELLTASGARVIAVDIAFEREGDEGGIRRIPCNVSDEPQVTRLFSELAREFGPVDILVNCAGVLEQVQRSVDKDLDDWDRVFAVNVRGTFLCSKEAGRQMVRQRKGAIVNIGSAAGQAAIAGSNAYGPSKAAVAHLTRSLACEWGRFGVRVNCVAPGHIETPMSEALFARVSYGKDRVVQCMPMQRMGDPFEVANAVMFLVSPYASFVTGAVLPVDGGWTSALPMPTS